MKKSVFLLIYFYLPFIVTAQPSKGSLAITIKDFETGFRVSAEASFSTEPWQAQAFALAVRLSAQGYFTWKEWASALADELKSAVDRDEPDDGSHYYEHWVAALETLVTARSLAASPDLTARKAEWAEAYRRTPHGSPVEL